MKTILFKSAAVLLLSFGLIKSSDAQGRDFDRDNDRRFDRHDERREHVEYSNYGHGRYERMVCERRFIPGHFVIDRCGRRVFVPGHYC